MVNHKISEIYLLIGGYIEESGGMGMGERGCIPVTLWILKNKKAKTKQSKKTEEKKKSTEILFIIISVLRLGTFIM